MPARARPVSSSTKPARAASEHGGGEHGGGDRIDRDAVRRRSDARTARRRRGTRRGRGCPPARGWPRPARSAARRRTPMGRPLATRSHEQDEPQSRGRERRRGPTGGGRRRLGLRRPAAHQARALTDGPGRGCGLRDGAAVALVAVDRALVLGEGLAELVAAVVAAHEVEVRLSAGWSAARSDARPGRGDGARRQARAAVRVVRRVDVEVLLADVAVPGAGLAQRVDDGGVGLQRHPPLQAVQEHRGDARPLLRRAPSRARRSRPGSPPGAACRPLGSRSAGAPAPITSRKRWTMRATSSGRRARRRAGCRRCRERDSPRGPWRPGSRSRIERGVARGGQEGLAPGCPRAAASRAMSSRFVPSGKVTSWRTTSPAHELVHDLLEAQRAFERVLARPQAARPSPRLSTRARNTSGWRTRPSSWSWRPMRLGARALGTMSGLRRLARRRARATASRGPRRRRRTATRSTDGQEELAQSSR